MARTDAGSGASSAGAPRSDEPPAGARYCGRWLPSVVRQRAAGEIVVLDTETTGLPIAGEPRPAVWEIGAVRLRPGRPPETGERFSALLELPADLPVEIGELCGVELDVARRSGGERRRTLAAFADWIGDAVVAGHNIRAFDAPLLAGAYADAAYAEAAAGTPLDFRGATAYGVINLLNGNILMSGGWGSAAPVPRGNLKDRAADPTLGRACLGHYGIAYLDAMMADPAKREIVARLRDRYGDDVAR